METASCAAPAIEDSPEQTPTSNIMVDTSPNLHLTNVSYREIFDSINDGLFLICPDTGRGLEVNLPVCRMFGYDRSELLGQTLIGELSSGTPPYTEEGAFEYIARARSGEPQIFEWQCRAKGGRLFWAEMSARYLELNGIPTIVTVMREISERKELAARFRQLAENISEVFWMSDPELTEMLYISPGYEAIWGRSCEDLYRDPSLWLDAIHEEDRARVTSAVAPPRHSAYHQEYRIVRPDGSVRWIADRGFPVEDDFGRVYRIAGVARDVTEHKRIEQMKDEFISTVSHELRTPLTSISGSLGLLAGGAAGELPDRASRLIDIAHSNCERLVRLINDILDLEKIESGRMAFQMKPVDIDLLVRQALEQNGAYADKYGVRLDYEPSKDMPRLRGDPDRLTQVLTNVLGNAIKFSSPGGVVTVSSSHNSASLRVSVRDRGPGIPEDFQSRLFDRFAQADSSDTRQNGGTGLGLPIAREITLRHGGELSYTTAPHWGTEFHIDLPLHGPSGSKGDDDSAHTSADHNS